MQVVLRSDCTLRLGFCPPEAKRDDAEYACLEILGLGVA
ncbi:hypothetical protein RIEGSTA812A_PEG_417 [invertebrate metagenome]|uniref:Uncharacterized protein n=1 Tax=invertebrate metagenome TaxID=1711999 RepID=A0A484H608_9ZZZZ